MRAEGMRAGPARAPGAPEASRSHAAPPRAVGLALVIFAIAMVLLVLVAERRTEDGAPPRHVPRESPVQPTSDAPRQAITALESEWQGPLLPSPAWRTHTKSTS